MKNFPRLSVLALAISVSACSFAPLKKPQTPTVSDHYAAQAPGANSAQATGRSQQYDSGATAVPDWWQRYQSTTLNALVEEGLQHNASLQATQHALASAHELLKARVRQSQLPTLDGNAQSSRQRALGVPEFGPATDLYDVYAGQLQLSYNFDLFGAIRHGNQQARAQVDQQAFELDAARRALAANIVIQAIDTASLQAQLDDSAQLAQLAHAQADTTARSYKLGSASHAQWLQAVQSAATADANLPALQAELLRSRHALAVLLGRTPDQAPMPIALDSLHLPEHVPVSLPSDLLRQRPDILAADAAVHAAAAYVGVTTANLFPQISLTASTGSAAFNAGTLFSSAAAVWSVGASVTQPIFHGGALLAQRRAAVESYNASIAQYRQTVLSAFQNVADSFTALDQDALSLQATAAASDAAQTMHAETDARYRLGAVSYPQQLTDEQRWRQAELATIQARATRLVDTAALFQAMGIPVPAQKPELASR